MLHHVFFNHKYTHTPHANTHTHIHHMQTHTHTYTPHTHTHTQSDKERKEKKVISKICKHSTSNVRNLQVAYCDSVAAQLPNRKLPEINSHSKVAKGHNKKYIICSDPRGNLCNYAIVLLSVAIPEKCANSWIDRITCTILKLTVSEVENINCSLWEYIPSTLSLGIHTLNSSKPELRKFPHSSEHTHARTHARTHTHTYY